MQTVDEKPLPENDAFRPIGLNDALRFILELVGLFSFGYWGFIQNLGLIRFGLAIFLPILIAILWGTFRVPGDPSHNGKAPVPIPGVLRLALELSFFIGASFLLYISDLIYVSAVFFSLVVIHYVLARERIRWLVKK